MIKVVLVQFNLVDNKYENDILSTNPLIHIYINRTNNRLAFNIKDGYKLELQTPETRKLFGCIKKLIGKTKNGENVLSLKVVEIVLDQCNFVGNQYQQKSEVLHIFTPYAYLLNVEPSNLVFLKTYNTDNEIIITFTDQNGRPLEIKDKVNLPLLINK